jgi:hypothetical protein
VDIVILRNSFTTAASQGPLGNPIGTGAVSAATP